MIRPAALRTLLAVSLLAWFASIHNGHAGSTGTTHTEPSPKVTDSAVRQAPTFVLVRPAPTEPALRVHLSAGRTLATNGNEAFLGLIVTDPQGRRSGIDFRNQATYREIPNSNVERVAPPAKNANGASGIAVSIKPAMATLFSLEINARQAGDYRLAVSGVSPTLESITEISGGYVPLDTSVHYRIDLTKVRSLPLHGTLGIVTTVVEAADRFVSQPEERMIPPSDPTVLAAAAVITKDPCGYFLNALKAVPHEKLTRNDGRIESLWDGKPRTGCEVRLLTNDMLHSGQETPHFAPFEGTELYRLGWRINDTTVADAPGTGRFGMENDVILCLVSSDQPAYMDEKTNEIIQSETLTVTVQCWQK